MRSVISRLIFSKQSIPRLNTMAVSGNGRYMTTDSTKVDESFKVDKTSKVEEAEAVDVPPPPTQKLLVLGGSGFVGSHVCREALDRGLTVASLSRSGRSSIRDSWANHVTWHQGNLLLPDTLKEALSGATAVVSCFVSFDGNLKLISPLRLEGRYCEHSGDKEGNNNSGNCEEHLGKPICTLALFKFIGGFMSVWPNVAGERRKLCKELAGVYSWCRIPWCIAGDHNTTHFSSELDWEMEFMELVLDNLYSTEIRLEGEDKMFLYPSKTYGFQLALDPAGVKRFVYVSATDFGVANYLLQGYYAGKRAAETELLSKFPYSGVILRPGFIYGTRSVGSMKIPLGVIGSPLEMVLQHAKPMSQLPLVGPLFISPVNVTAVAQVAVRAATDPVFPPGIIDVPGIQRYSQQKSS
ncbi:uncharacterized protein LOC112003124 [Quercus suber]|uniref:uncharacterized protein LOC112003124 n=1 Tax=Quercus suber TaxID=58331 RepID=UPI0032E05024